MRRSEKNRNQPFAFNFFAPVFFCIHSLILQFFLSDSILYLKVYNCFVFSVSSHINFFLFSKHVKVHSYQCKIPYLFFIPSSKEKKSVDFEIIAHIILCDVSGGGSNIEIENKCASIQWRDNVYAIYSGSWAATATQTSPYQFVWY